MFYLLICGRPLFNTMNFLESVHNIQMNGRIDFSKDVSLKNISNEIVDLLKMMVCVDANKRSTASEVLKRTRYLLGQFHPL